MSITKTVHGYTLRGARRADGSATQWWAIFDPRGELCTIHVNPPASFSVEVLAAYVEAVVNVDRIAKGFVQPGEGE